MLLSDLSRSLGGQVAEISGNTGNDGGLALSVGTTYLPRYRPKEAESDSDGDLENQSSSLSSKNARIHEYRSLKAYEIRLLVLNPGLPEDPIECFTEHFSVNQAKGYKALSYVWGDTEDSTFIQVDGSPFKVTKNLRDFLASYRTNNTCPVLWVDAVCINQRDIPERNSQIRLMKRVYEGADSILVWLGNEIEGTESAVEHMEYIYEDIWLPRLQLESSNQAALSYVLANDVPKIFGDDLELHPQTWPAISDLLERPWWSRIWVYQEATAPAKYGSVVFCGSHSIDFEKVLAINKIVQYLALSKVPGFGYQGTLTGALMDIYSKERRNYHEHGTSEFLKLADLLPTLRGFAATNPRDKLYALIPTSLDGADLLDVDYALSVEEVYTNATFSFMQKHRNLDILAHCTQREAESKLTLPSWVPDWTSNRAPVQFFKRGLTRHGDLEHIGKLYNASLHSLAITRVDASFKRLFCTGFEYDVVDFVSPSTNEVYQTEKITIIWKEWLKSTLHSFAEEVLARTLAADCTRVGVDLACRGYNEQLSKMEAHSAIIGITGAHPATFRRRLIITRKRHLGLAAEHVKPGDMVTILMGGQLPMILRKVNDHYLFIGEAYIHGIMDGEAMAQNEVSNKSPQSSAKEFEIW
jgi:hypothetical protein